MSELGENEEGVGEEQIPETFSRLSLVPQENIILGGKKSFFFFLSLPTHTCNGGCVEGASIGAILGKSCSIVSGEEVTSHSWGNWKPLEK